MGDHADDALGYFQRRFQPRPKKPKAVRKMFDEFDEIDFELKFVPLEEIAGVPQYNTNKTRRVMKYLDGIILDDETLSNIKRFDDNAGAFVTPIEVLSRKKNAIVIRYLVNQEAKSGMPDFMKWKNTGVLGRTFVPIDPATRQQYMHIVFLDTTYSKTKETKKMNEDFEFYLALLQSSGVKMVVCIIGEQEYDYLCAIEVQKGDNVVVQARDQLMVATVEEVLEEWDMDIVETIGERLKWIISVADISNVKRYEDQKRKVFEQLRQSRLMEKAKKFAGAANLDFNSLVAQTQNTLAIAHDETAE